MSDPLRSSKIGVYHIPRIHRHRPVGGWTHPKEGRIIMAESNKAQIDVVQFTLRFLAALPQEVKLEVARLLVKELLEEVKEDEIDDPYEEALEYEEEYEDPRNEDGEFHDSYDEDLESDGDNEYMVAGPVAIPKGGENARERIVELRFAGVTFRRIAGILNEEGFRTQSNEAFTYHSTWHSGTYKAGEKCPKSALWRRTCGYGQAIFEAGFIFPHCSICSGCKWGIVSKQE